MSVSFDVFGHDSNPVVYDLKKSTSNGKSAGAACPADGKRACSQESHERRMPRQNADLTVVRRRDDRVGFPVEHRRFRRYNRDLHHELPSFSAFATASSMLPTM
jgi:hypothetical protein